MGSHGNLLPWDTVTSRYLHGAEALHKETERGRQYIWLSAVMLKQKWSVFIFLLLDQL